MSLCDSCYYNTVQNYFSPATVVFKGKVKITDECVQVVLGYPKMKECRFYEDASKRDPESEE